MLSQLSYFPPWTPQRGVARCVCHSSAAVKSFLCTGHPSVRREEPAIRDMQGPVATKSAPAAGEHACTSGHQDGKEAPCPLLAPVVSKAFPPWYAGRRAPAFSRNAWAKPGRSEAGLRTSAQSVRTRGIPGPCLPAGNPHATPDKARGIPGGRSFRHPLKKIGRAAPVGAWLPRKKTL